MLGKNAMNRNRPSRKPEKLEVFYVIRQENGKRRLVNTSMRNHLACNNYSSRQEFLLKNNRKENDDKQ